MSWFIELVNQRVQADTDMFVYIWPIAIGSLIVGILGMFAFGRKDK